MHTIYCHTLSPRSSISNSKIKQIPWISWIFIVFMAVKIIPRPLRPQKMTRYSRRCYQKSSSLLFVVISSRLALSLSLLIVSLFVSFSHSLFISLYMCFAFSMSY